MTLVTEELYYSTLAKDADLAEIVAMFVDEMPLRLRDLQAQFGCRQSGQLARLSHQLKGAAGSYGFDQITAFARAWKKQYEMASRRRRSMRHWKIWRTPAGGCELVHQLNHFIRRPTVSVTASPSTLNFDFSSKPFSSSRYSKGPSPEGSLISFSLAGPSCATAMAAMSIARRT